jgi:hypothetical protein
VVATRGHVTVPVVPGMRVMAASGDVVMNVRARARIVVPLVRVTVDH